jgi:hypothetical protein
MNDTQGSGAPGVSTNGVSTRLMAPVVDRLVFEHGIDMLIHVGDLIDQGGRNEFNQWLETAFPLHNMNIDIYPIRGNHDVKSEMEIEAFDPLFGPFSFADTSIWDSTFPHLDPTNPSCIVERGPGASYAFTYDNTRFVALDLYGSIPVETIGWLTAQNKEDAEHMFVYAHEPFFGRAHEGVVGDDPLRMQLMGLMAANGTEAYFSGHDHQYSRSAAVLNGHLILQHYVLGSNAEKYYRFENEVNTSEEVGFKQINDRVAYSIVSINGPFVTFEQYMSDHPDPQDPFEIWIPNWYLADRATYSTNGHMYAVEAGGSYEGLGSFIPEGDGFVGTSGQILAGSNDTYQIIVTDPDPGITPVSVSYGNQVSFGWRLKDALGKSDDCDDPVVVSDIMMLDGMADVPDGSTDIFILSMHYDDGVVSDEMQLRLGYYQEASCDKKGKGPNKNKCDKKGKWARAVKGNFGGKKKFVLGGWDADYGLGTYGVDVEANTVWAVINHNGDFAVILADD